MSRRQLAQIGEDLATEYLCLQGCSLLERNWRCPYGEIDIIAEHNGQILFVEVKTRQHHISPAEAVDKHKQARLRRCAEAYLDAHAIEAPCRFDVIEVWWSPDRPELRWIQQAF